MDNTLLSILTTLLAAIIGSYATLQKFKREKLWQEKYTAYRDLIAALENIRYWGKEINRAYLHLPISGFPDNKEPWELLSEAMRKLDYYSVVGSLLFANHVHELVNKLIEEVNIQRHEGNKVADDFDSEDKQKFVANNADAIRNIVDQYMPQIIRAAKSEL